MSGKTLNTEPSSDLEGHSNDWYLYQVRGSVAAKQSKLLHKQRRAQRCAWYGVMMRSKYEPSVCVILARKSSHVHGKSCT